MKKMRILIPRLPGGSVKVATATGVRRYWSLEAALRAEDPDGYARFCAMRVQAFGGCEAAVLGDKDEPG